jgi:hypothetical protein
MRSLYFIILVYIESVLTIEITDSPRRSLSDLSSIALFRTKIEAHPYLKGKSLDHAFSLFFCSFSSECQRNTKSVCERTLREEKSRSPGGNLVESIVRVPPLLLSLYFRPQLPGFQWLRIFGIWVDSAWFSAKRRVFLWLSREK